MEFRKLLWTDRHFFSPHYLGIFAGQGPVNQAEAKERMMAMEAQLRHITNTTWSCNTPTSLPSFSKRCVQGSLARDFLVLTNLVQEPSELLNKHQMDFRFWLRIHEVIRFSGHTAYSAKTHSFVSRIRWIRIVSPPRIRLRHPNFIPRIRGIRTVLGFLRIYVTPRISRKRTVLFRVFGKCAKICNSEIIFVFNS